jgi:hypothetical protein
MAVVPNPPGEWLKRYWLWIVVLGALVLFALTQIFKGEGGKPALMKKTVEDAERIHENANAELDSHIAKMGEREKEFAEIEAISDEEKRLQALADFANRTGQS